MLHGALIGILATAMYLGLVFAQPGGFAAAVGTYGVPLFCFSQAMRIAGWRRPQSKTGRAEFQLIDNAPMRTHACLNIPELG